MISGEEETRTHITYIYSTRQEMLLADRTEAINMINLSPINPQQKVILTYNITMVLN